MSSLAASLAAAVERARQRLPTSSSSCPPSSATRPPRRATTTSAPPQPGHARPARLVGGGDGLGEPGPRPPAGRGRPGGLQEALRGRRAGPPGPRGAAGGDGRPPPGRQPLRQGVAAVMPARTRNDRLDEPVALERPCPADGEAGRAAGDASACPRRPWRWRTPSGRPLRRQGERRPHRRHPQHRGALRLPAPAGGPGGRRELLLGSPFDYARSTLVLLPPDMPEPSEAAIRRRWSGR